MKKLNLKDRHRISLSILIQIDRLCREEGIEYFAAYGTLIGAVRHKGFIPWDDDIDIWVKWKDYHRLIELVQQRTQYRIVNLETDPNVPILFTKISDRNTVVKSTKKENDSFKRGISIDVFPLCDLEESKVFRVEFKILLFFNKLFSSYRRLVGAPASVKGRIIKISCSLLNWLHMGQKFWRKKIERFFTKSGLNGKAKKLFHPYSIHHKRHNAYPKSWFEGSIDLPFEEMKVRCPVEYDRVLREIFGDYMKLPPVEEQVGHDTVVYLLSE